MFSFYHLLQELERYDDEVLQELIKSPIVLGIGAILGLKYMSKKGKERDAMLSCQNECIRSKTRPEFEKCVADCFNQKMVLITHRYKTIKGK
jgi:hypothetical protein